MEFHSLEEEDLLEQSRKRKKTMKQLMTMGEEDVVMNTMHHDGAIEYPKDGDEGEVSRTFLDILTANKIHKQIDDEEASNDDEGLQEDEDPNFLIVRLTRKEKTRLRRPWRQTLIVKVWGRSVSYNYLLRRLRTIWHPKAGMELIAIENDFFLVKFASMEDYSFAKYEGPWMVLDYYLIINSWTPNFDPTDDKTEKILVWVRFPSLPIEYFDENFQMKIGGNIGEPMKVDYATRIVSRGKYDRLCVEVDLAKPLLSKYKMRRQIRRIEYEGLHLFCFECRMYEHMQDSCPSQKDDQKTNEVGNNQPGTQDTALRENIMETRARNVQARKQHTRKS